MKYIGFDMGDGESAVAAFEHGSSIEPVIWPICGSKSFLSAVGLRNGEIVIGERAYTDALAENLSVRFKSRFTSAPTSNEDIVRFVRGSLKELMDMGRLSHEDVFIVGCPAGWNTASRARYRELLTRAGVAHPRLISESRAAFLYAKYARTIALDIDLLNESALVADIGSSTLDYAYIVDGRETGVGTFGETHLGGGILDAALLRRAVERSRSREAIQEVFRESRSWYSYCEIEARRLKEAFFEQLEADPAPVVKKQLRICYDGMEKLPIEITPAEMAHVVEEPLPELDGLTFTDALRTSLQNAARLTADRPPKLMLLTGGASRMPFFRQLCREVFPSAVVYSCPEPEFSIAKGLAYAGWVDENLRAFRKAIDEAITEECVWHIADEAIPALLPSVADILCRLMIDEAALPIARQWKRGAIATLSNMERQITDRVERVLTSDLAQEALTPALEAWSADIAKRLQALIDPICDAHNVPRKEMRIGLTFAGAGQVNVSSDTWSGLSGVRTLMSILMSIIGGTLCGGGGLALLTTGPLGFLAGAAIGAVASLLGWGAVSKMLMKADLPLLLRNVPIEKRLQSDQTRHELRKRLLQTISPADSAFRTGLCKGFAQAFRTHVASVAQAAEIPIE